jgi:hypothetical protein
MSGIRSPWRPIVALAAGAVIIFTAAGCSSKSTNDSGTSAAGRADTAAESGPKPQQPPAAPVLNVQPRSLVFTGTVTVRVDKVDQAASSARALATDAGGFVSGDDRSGDKTSYQVRLTLRVPSARFSSVVDGLTGLGQPESRKLSTEDVTDQVVDLEARISTGQASVDRVRALLAKAQNISDIVALESELSRREADLESLKSRRTKLDDLTTLSTITAVLVGKDAPAAKPRSGFLIGLSAGWHAFTGSLQVLLTVLGALLPWVLALGVPVLLLVWIVHRVRRPAPPATTTD